LRPTMLASAALFAFALGALPFASIDSAAASQSSRTLVQSGAASWYAMGTRTASGQPYDPDGLSAAHRFLPFGVRLLVTNKDTGLSVVVTVNDRGPFVHGRILDLSRGAARRIGMIGRGIAKVTLAIATEVASGE
jgi:rare lipoprotein A